MTSSDFLRTYKTMSAEDRRTFDRWLKANAFVGSIVAAGLVAMALAGANAFGPREAVAESKNVSVMSASENQRQHDRVLSAFWRLQFQSSD